MSALQYETQLIKLIETGNLQEIQKVYIGTKDIDRTFNLTSEIQTKPKSNQSPFPTISAPTPIILAILDEQPEILSFFVKAKTPDLSIAVNGWLPIHYAASTASCECLKVLLGCEYIQKNLEAPVFEPFQTTAQASTNSLHIAVTNKRHASVIILLSELPVILVSADGHALSEESAPQQKGAFQHCNPNTKTTAGNTPLHIAAKLKDWDLCQILICVGADKTIVNSQGKTAAEIARDAKAPDLAAKIDAGVTEPLSVLKERYLGEGPKEEPAKVVEVRSVDVSNDINELRKEVESLKLMVSVMNKRILALEAPNAK